ncbi:MAG TPA: hypothetical protein VGJ20_44985 [Xanthobacteraceae bacterium]
MRRARRARRALVLQLQASAWRVLNPVSIVTNGLIVISMKNDWKRIFPFD